MIPWPGLAGVDDNLLDRVSTLVAMDGRRHSPYNLANWVNAGFMRRK
jgi:hypothetical protein